MSRIVRVLLVDDEPDIREVALLSLQLDPDMDVKAVATAGEALEILARTLWTPHLILLDVMMPGIDGLRALKLLRSIEGGIRVPVVFMTARTRESDLAALREAGAVAVITKPFSPLLLAGRVREILEQGG